jgi:hypothetical protein
LFPSDVGINDFFGFTMSFNPSDWRLATGDLQLATCNWRLATGDLQLATCNWRLAACNLHVLCELINFDTEIDKWLIDIFASQSASRK